MTPGPGACRLGAVIRQGTLVVALSALAWLAASAHAASQPVPGRVHASGVGSVRAARTCHATRVYGSARITVRRARGVACRAAVRLAKRAVVYREKHGFAKHFCHLGWCWRFGEFHGRGEGLSSAKFHGQSGGRRIDGTEVVA